MGVLTDIIYPTKDWYSVACNDSLDHRSYYDMRNWLDEVTQGQYFIVSIKDIRFKLHEDAVMFRLRWG